MVEVAARQRLDRTRPGDLEQLERSRRRPEPDDSLDIVKGDILVPRVTSRPLSDKLTPSEPLTLDSWGNSKPTVSEPGS